MVRAPCCEKIGLKKGPWTADEDLILISYVSRYGHQNWRAVPKQAGLLRCGKSCRLRWTNYLRPDIKRGNFTREEEDTIISLHEMLGNRWSAIAARLPGRTDNEIKNVWHTHIKKRLKLQNLKDAAISIEIESEPIANNQQQKDNCITSSQESSFHIDESSWSEFLTPSEEPIINVSLGELMNEDWIKTLMEAEDLWDLPEI